MHPVSISPTKVPRLRSVASSLRNRVRRLGVGSIGPVAIDTNKNVLGRERWVPQGGRGPRVWSHPTNGYGGSRVVFIVGCQLSIIN